MPTLTTAQVDIDTLQRLVDAGYLTARPHPTADLLIWNYTPRCQFERYWTPETMMCRGLITKPDGMIVARGFEKFFNIEEHQGDLPLEPFKVTEKMDGSLGILYFVDGVPQIATRGSFTSDQALRATKILHERYSSFEFKPYYTYLFEVVYKENRIVVDYGDMEDIVLLALIHTQTGKEYDIHDPMWVDSWPFPIVKHYDGITDLAKLREVEEENKEGFVIRFESGLRVKAKYREYVRLHALLTQCTARTVWEYLKENKPLAEILDRVPDEFTARVKSISKELTSKYQAIHHRTQTVYKGITAQATIHTPLPVGSTLTVREVDMIYRAMKKHIKEQFAQHPDIEPFLLMLYSGGHDKKEQVRKAIWETLRPAAERPFRMDEE